MLKKLLIAVSFIAGAMTLSACTDEKPVTNEIKITEGIHYTKLDTPVDRPANEVLEFFWFGCPHCYDADKPVKEWAEKNKGKYNLTQLHSHLSNKWMFDAFIFYSLDALGREKEIHKAYFDARQNGSLGSEADLDKFLASYNLTIKDLEVASELPETLAKRDKLSAMERSLNPQGVPIFVIGGKYMLKLEGLETVGGWEGVDKIFNHLLEKSKAEK